MGRRWTLAIAMSLVALAGCEQSSGQATNSASPEKPPAQRISEFEDSAFCRKYHCLMDTPICVVGLDGKVERWHYTYRLEGNELMNVDFSLSASGERMEPYAAVYWHPLKPVETESATASATTTTTNNAVPDKEFAPARDLVSEITGSREFDASAYARKCFLSYTNGKAEIGGAVVKSYAVECSYAESDDQKRPEQKMFPQLTMVIAKLPIARK